MHRIDKKNNTIEKRFYKIIVTVVFFVLFFIYSGANEDFRKYNGDDDNIIAIWMLLKTAFNSCLKLEYNKAHVLLF